MLQEGWFSSKIVGLHLHPWNESAAVLSLHASLILHHVGIQDPQLRQSFASKPAAESFDLDEDGSVALKHVMLEPHLRNPTRHLKRLQQEGPTLDQAHRWSCVAGP